LQIGNGIKGEIEILFAHVYPRAEHGVTGPSVGVSINTNDPSRSCVTISGGKMDQDIQVALPSWVKKDDLQPTFGRIEPGQAFFTGTLTAKVEVTTDELLLTIMEREKSAPNRPTVKYRKVK
jgi:hypothetical protein